MNSKYYNVIIEFLILILLVAGLVGCANCNGQKTGEIGTNYNPGNSMPDTVKHERLSNCTGKIEVKWSQVQPGLFGIYCDLFNRSDSIGGFSFPNLFYIDLSDCMIELDSLKYDWENDVITSICFEDESMIWSTSDTIYTKGNSLSYSRCGENIGNILHDVDIINDLRAWNEKTEWFEHEITDPVYAESLEMNIINIYCKVVIKKGSAVSVLTRAGSATKKQFEVIPGCVTLREHYKLLHEERVKSKSVEN